MHLWVSASSSKTLDRAVYAKAELEARLIPSKNARGKNQFGFMWTFAQSANPVKPPGTKARVAATRVSYSGPK
jgi:hypothetical protein